MPHYAYTARDKDGRTKEGTREGQNQEEVLSFLHASGLLVTRISEVQETKTFRKPKKKIRRRMHSRVRLDDMILMARQLATLVSAGVTLLRSLEIIVQQVQSQKLQKALEAVQDDIRSGKTFHAALAKHPKIFSDFWVNLIRMGEAGGHLAQTLEQLASYLESAGALRTKAISAMVYPVILVGFASLVIMAFLFKIVPIFQDLFQSFGIELPALTRTVIFASDLLRKYFFITLPIIGGVVFLIRSFIKTEEGRLLWDRMKLSIPIVGELFRKIAVANFARGLGTLIKSGVPILYSLEIIGKSAGNKVVSRILEDVRLEVREGKPIATPLGAGGVFDPIVVQMVRIGEEIGELGNMLEKVGKFYEDQVNTLTIRLVTMIEPLAILVMGVVVGILVLSMYLPIFSISQIADQTM